MMLVVKTVLLLSFEVAGGPVAVPPPHLHAMPQHSGPPPGHPPAPVPHVNPAFFPSATSAPSNVPGAVSTICCYFLECGLFLFCQLG